LIPTKTINLSYSYYLISACFNFARQSIPSHMQPSLRKEDLNTFYCLDIPLQEQNNIEIYLNKIDSKIDKKKEIIKKQIELLKEYKQTIIYEAVTGKMEIL
jgi:type I restriction enzyme S subunit